MNNAQILVGDARIRLAELADGSVQTCITSPPYFGLRDYGHGDQMGLEATPDEYVKGMVDLFREVWRVLADDGTLWLNLGDSYAGSGRGPAGESSKQVTNKGAMTGTIREAKHMSIGLKMKDLIGIPWRVAFALQADGWWLRQDIIWAKPNPMPESVTDRCTKSHEYLFLLSKSARYFYDAAAIAEPALTGWNGSEFDTLKTGEHQMGRSQKRHDPGQERTPYGAPGQTAQMTKRAQPRFGGDKYGDSDDPLHATKSGNEYEPTGLRNKRDVWTISTKPFKGAHFAVMPEALVEPCVLAGSREGDTVLDPFAGSGTVGVVALRHQRNFVGCEMNPEYAEMAKNRITDDAPMLNDCMVKTYLSQNMKEN
jgi:DNA modification methylase